MKKHLFTTLAVAVLMAIGAHAQSDNTYNMVIEMTNGMKFTIGPNDIQNISFNEGQITISGTGLQQLLEANEQLKNALEATNQKVSTVSEQNAENSKQTAELVEFAKTASQQADVLARTTNDLSAELDSLARVVAGLAVGGGGDIRPELVDSIVRVLRLHQNTVDRMAGYPSWNQVQTQINQYSRQADDAQAKLNNVISNVDALQKTTSTTDKNLSALTSRVTTAEGKISTAEGKISTLETKVAGVESNVSNKASKDDLTKAVNEINTSIKKVNDSISSLTTRVGNLEKAVDALKKQ